MVLVIVAVLMVLIVCQLVYGQNKAGASDVFARKNLFAWSIVPFDVKKRCPVERAEMLQKLGITKLAYDWRKEHISTFDQELETLKKYNIKLEAFWLPTGSDPANDKNVQEIFALLKIQMQKLASR